MNPDEYYLLVDGELDAIVSEQDAKDVLQWALREYRCSVVTLAKPDGEGHEELSEDEYTRLGL